MTPPDEEGRPSVASLRALPLAARYDAMRAIIEQGQNVEWARGQAESLPDVFRRLCTRKHWPSGRQHPDMPGYARANRWNYPAQSLGLGVKLPPSLSASSPEALYRLLHVVEPARLVARAQTRDYYQGGLFKFYSPDRRYLCWIAFQKRELELSFYCPRGDLFLPEEPVWPESLRVQPQTEEERANWYVPETGGWATFIRRPENRATFDAYQAAETAYREQGLVVPWSSGRMRCQRLAGQAWARLIVAVANTPWDLYPGNGFRV